MRLTVQRVVMACFCAVAPAAIGCGDGSVNPVAPSDNPAVSSLAKAGSRAAASFPRSGDIHVTKECSMYFGDAGDFCTITSSNVREIEVGSRVIYSQAADFSAPMFESDVVLDVPGPGNNTAFGHCQVSNQTGNGLCTFSGGTGKFTHFRGSASVSYLGGLDYAWDGTYTFDPRD